ncbi:cyclase family protein [Streptomyces sp. NPDC056660]|uniref:cyclase family protein n=1 Tax=Streptomyces sp. NPDC056660 TaxID=3345897 RepID=UPI003688F457
MENATREIRPGDIVMINTGAHRLYGDNDAYYSYSPGLYTEGAQWLVDKGVTVVGVDVQALDHPLGTQPTCSARCSATSPSANRQPPTPTAP